MRATVCGPSSPIASVLLPEPFHQVPGRRYLLSVVPLGTKPVSFGVASDVKVACRLLADLQFERERSRLVSSWQDTRDLLDSLRDIHGHSEQSLFAREALERAESLFAAGTPEEAYTAGIRAEQLTLPATFALPAAVVVPFDARLGVALAVGVIPAAVPPLPPQ